MRSAAVDLSHLKDLVVSHVASQMPQNGKQTAVIRIDIVKRCVCTNKLFIQPPELIVVPAMLPAHCRRTRTSLAGTLTVTKSTA